MRYCALFTLPLCCLIVLLNIGEEGLFCLLSRQQNQVNSTLPLSSHYIKKTARSKFHGPARFNSSDILTLWESKVNLHDKYFEICVNHVKAFEELQISWNIDGKDFGRICTLIDFVTWVQKYNLTSPQRLLTTCVEDPELKYISPQEIVEYKYEIELGTGDLHDLNKIELGEKFDFMIFSHTLEHLWNPMLCVQNIFMKMKPGGYVFTSVPALNMQHMTPYHYQHFTPMGLAILFRGAGFEIDEIGQWGNLNYEIVLLSNLGWPDWNTLQKPILNQREHPCQVWILAHKPNSLAAD